MTMISEHCSQNEHKLLGLFKGSPDEQLLARESHELFHELEPILADFFQLAPAQQSTSLLDAMPTLQLFFSKVAYLPQTPFDMLQAFVKLARHSTKLNAWPEVKTAFWLTMANTMLINKSKHIVKPLIPHPSFPQFIVCYGRPRTRAWCTVDEAMGDAMCDLLTSSSGDESKTVKPCLGLSFGFGWPKVAHTQDEMELIEHMLDRLFESPTLNCKISSLVFACSIMTARLLAVSARIVDKCRSGHYQIEYVNFDGVIPVSDMPGYEPSEVPWEFHYLVARACHVDALPRVMSLKSPPVVTGNGQSTLDKVSLSGNFLTSNFFPVHFSALRYGCILEQDLTEYSIESSHAHPDINLNSWRWLAFGLFYPRPKRFADAFKLRTIGKLTVSSAAIRMIVNTVHNPVSQLLNNDLDGDDTTVANCLMVCAVKEGATIEVFVSGVKQELVVKGNNAFLWESKAIVPTVHTAAETTEFEALCEREDGSVCIVVPGAGLGWVARNDVVLLEREPLDLARSALDGLYDASVVCAISTAVPTDRLRLFFETIGRQFKSLTFDFDFEERSKWHSFSTDFSLSEDESVMQSIVDHCPHLQQLNVIDAPPREIDVLLEALDTSELGAKLVTLNLNDNKSMDDAAFERLVSIVATTTDPLALQELRVVHKSASPAAMTQLHDALLANRKLALLELYCAKNHQPRDPLGYDKRMEEEARLETVFQCQVLRNYSPMDVKLAFLSVMSDNSATKSNQARSSRLALDEEVLSQILGFAASLELRRGILWNELDD